MRTQRRNEPRPPLARKRLAQDAMAKVQGQSERNCNIYALTSIAGGRQGEKVSDVNGIFLWWCGREKSNLLGRSKT
jgi:hypothetical protein